MPLGMSEQQITIPYRRGYTPLQWPRYHGPWPRPNMPPYSRDAWFTNLDERLRPNPTIFGDKLYFLPNQPDRIEVTHFNFPALHKLFQDLVARADVAPMQLYILREFGNKGYISGNTVGISLDQLNVNDFESLQFLLGHEIGHKWQRKHAGRGNYTQREQGIAPAKKWEAEADQFALCVSRLPARDIARGIDNMGPSGGPIHPSNDLRISALYKMQMGDCDFFELPQPLRIPHKPQSQKKARN